MVRPVSARGAHRRDIQGLRGVAVLLVVAFHAGIGPRGGFVGVDVFLVISGFVIARGLVNERIRTGTVRLRSFFARRVRRLLPAMAVFTVCTAIVGTLVLSPFGDQQRILSTGAAATVFLANVQLYRTTGYFDGSADRNPFLHTWSLSLEEQFYALLPLALTFTWWLARRRGDQRDTTTNRPFGVRRVALVVVVGLGAMSLVLSMLLISGVVGFALEAPQRLVFFSMPTRIWQFSAGVVLALAHPPSGRVGTRTTGALGLGALVALLGAAVVVDPLAPHMNLWTVLVVAAVVVVIMTVTPEGPGTRLLSSPPLVWVGDRSYGWYLWHWPFVVFAGVLWPDRPGVLVLAAVVSLVPTELSYRFIERRFRFGAQWTGPRTAGLAAVCIVVPLLVLGGLRVAADGGLGLEEPSDWYDLPLTHGTDCHLINRDAANDLDREECTFGPTGSPGAGTVVLLGDALANAVGPGVVEAAAARGWNTLQWSREGCPFVGVAPGPHYPACGEWQADALELVEETDPEAVVLANQDLNEAQREALPGTLEELERLTDRVVLVAPVADFGDRFPRHRLSLLDPEPVTPSMTDDEVDRQRSGVVALLEDLVSRHPAAVMVDPRDRLCEGICSPERGSRWLYLEPRQLTATAARMLSEEFGAAFRAP